MFKNESFYRLTPDRVLGAVEAAGFLPTGHCTALNALENRVYDVRVDAPERPSHHLVVKFYRPGRWSREAIADEHRLLFALRESEIPVCAPLRFGSRGESIGSTQEIFYAIWPRIGGRAPDEFSDDEVGVLGRLLARIHAVAAHVDASHRPRFDSKTVALRALVAVEEGDFLPPSCAARYREAVMEIVEIYDQRSQGIVLQPIHGDCHAGNLLRGSEGWFFLDFDDMVIGPPVQDVWMLLPGRDEVAERQRRLLVESYRDFRDFDERSWSLVEPLRGFRFVFYAGWIARRFEDPSFPDAFPHFGSENYWESETRDLEQQIRRIRADGPPRATEPAAESGVGVADELTNKDFFWDL